MKHALSSAQQTLEFGKAFAAKLLPNTVVTLSGNLGAGKTTFVQGLAKGLDIEDPIVSPTFVYLNIYEGTLPLFHFDLYRLKSPTDFLELGFSEYLSKGGISVIEWPEKTDPIPGAIHLIFSYEKKGRTVHLAAGGANLLYSDLWG